MTRCFAARHFDHALSQCSYRTTIPNAHVNWLFNVVHKLGRIHELPLLLMDYSLRAAGSKILWTRTNTSTTILSTPVLGMADFSTVGALWPWLVLLYEISGVFGGLVVNELDLFLVLHDRLPHHSKKMELSERIGPNTS
ncbi:hypothetical protein SeMB42_g07047 [Synchytrium endobioticum]|uniref:Uncharacterized protein n=1 Tax=Synchytrium endobioticum TaxID=286115 RepID=A0A507CGX3_9FUNG|nr:hypothetical protein SeMB42_g07047 [Synchytrium endobioticum]